MGFNPILAPYTVNMVWNHDVGADEKFTILRFPAAGQIHGAYATNSTSIHALGGGTNYIAMYLEKYSDAATPVLQGTVGSWQSSTWVQDVPRAAVITAFGSTALFTAGEWLRLSYDENDLGNWTEMGMQVDYHLSKAAVGEPPTPSTGPA